MTDALEFSGLLTLAVTLLAIFLFLTGQFVPSWLLLARSLPRHGRANLTWQAMLTLLGLLVRGLQVLSLHKAARLRIEIELVNPLPDHPLRLHYRSKEDYHAAKKETERLLHLDADRSRNRPLDWIVAEMDDPYLTPAPTSGIDYFVWHESGTTLAISCSTSPMCSRPCPATRNPSTISP